MPNDSTAHRTTPREQGKEAYRQGCEPENNPFRRGEPGWEDWSDGWGWQSVHYPRESDQKVSPWEIDPSCRSSEIADWREYPI